MPKGALHQTNKEKAEKIESLNKHDHEEELNKIRPICIYRIFSNLIRTLFTVSEG
jgi:hypothetical protein